MTDDNHAIVLVHLQYIREGIAAINTRLDKLNGRVSASEDAIAAQGTSITVLQDRETEARSAARSTGARWGGAVGAGVAAAMAALWNRFAGQ